MKKVFLLLVLALLVVPTVFGLENVIPFAYGNDTELFFSITTVQSTTNPTIGANIAYVTTINVTHNLLQPKLLSLLQMNHLRYQ